MGLPCSKLKQPNLIIDRKIHNICSFQKVHKHSSIHIELVSTFKLKISNYISFINHLYRNNEKNVTYVTLWGAYMFSKGNICDAKIAYIDDIANLET